jgi:Tfp pilus assembly protein PilF
MSLLALSLLLFSGVLSRHISGAQADEFGEITLKGVIQLVDGGKIKRKIRVPSFETVEAPVGRAAGSLDRGILGRNLFEGTGEAGTLKQIYMRESTSYTEIIPVVFLKEIGTNASTRAMITEKGSFRFEALPAGEYELTIAVPGHTPVVKKLSLTRSGGNGITEFVYPFKASDSEESRLLQNHYNPKSISEKARSDYDRGVKAINEARLDEALTYLELAVERDDSFTEAFERMGLIYLSRGSMDKAENSFRMALQSDPCSYRSLSNLGTILLNSGEDAEAVKHHSQAVKMRPQDPQARYHLAMSYFQLGDMEKASDQLAKEKALAPNHFTQPQLLSAEIYRIQEDYDSMIQEMEAFLEVFPDDPKANQVRQALDEAQELQQETTD